MLQVAIFFRSFQEQQGTNKGNRERKKKMKEERKKRQPDRKKERKKDQALQHKSKFNILTIQLTAHGFISISRKVIAVMSS